MFDFNTFGSTAEWDSIPGVTVFDAARLDDAVVAYAEAICAVPGFPQALAEAEKWIIAHAPTPDGGASRPLRCHGVVSEAARSTTGESPTPVEDRWRACRDCMTARPANRPATTGVRQS